MSEGTANAATSATPGIDANAALRVKQAGRYLRNAEGRLQWPEAEIGAPEFVFDVARGCAGRGGNRLSECLPVASYELCELVNV
jgi:hypothetical protein